MDTNEHKNLIESVNQVSLGDMQEVSTEFLKKYKVGAKEHIAKLKGRITAFKAGSGTPPKPSTYKNIAKREAGIKAADKRLKRRRINPDKLGTGHAIVPDTIQGKPNPKQTNEGLNLKSLINDVQKKMKMTKFDRTERKRLKELRQEIHWYNTKILGLAESVELDEYRGEYDPEYEHEMEAHDAVKSAERKKGEKLTSAERKHHEDKAYHDIGYRDRHGAEIEQKAGKKLTYKEMMAAKAKTPKHKIPLGSAGNPAPLKSKK